MCVDYNIYTNTLYLHFKACNTTSAWRIKVTTSQIGGKMSVVEELLREEQDGTISFGNYELPAKAKLDNFKHGGDVLKVKTFKDITKLERNEMFVYESVPGTVVTHFVEDENGVEFDVEGTEDAQITVGLEDNTEYNVFVNGAEIGKMSTNLGGKLNLSVELKGKGPSKVKITK